MRSPRFALRLAAVALCAAGVVRPLFAQQTDWDPRRAEIPRESLEVLMARLDETARSPVYSAKLRDRSQREADLIRQRLTNGDFNTGDRIELLVESASPVRDSLTVDVGRMLNVPGVASIPLTGVLRSELNDYLTAQLRRYITNAVVHAQALIRVSVLGEVARPGFYTVPAEMLVDQVLMQAGGPTPYAQLDEVRIDRRHETVWSGDELQQAITEGRTLNALDVRAGDRIVVPRIGQHNWDQIARVAVEVASLPFTIIGLVRLFGG